MDSNSQETLRLIEQDDPEFTDLEIGVLHEGFISSDANIVIIQDLVQLSGIIII